MTLLSFSPLDEFVQFHPRDYKDKKRGGVADSLIIFLAALFNEGRRPSILLKRKKASNIVGGDVMHFGKLCRF